MLSRVIRRTHMFLALFFFPWIAMYAVSTLAMNHRAVFARHYGEGPVPFERERELRYDGTFPEHAELRMISRQLLAGVGLDGAHSVSRRDDGTIVINRNDLLAPRRLTYSPATRTAHRADAAAPECLAGALPSTSGLRHRLRASTPCGRCRWIWRSSRWCSGSPPAFGCGGRWGRRAAWALRRLWPQAWACLRCSWRRSEGTPMTFSHFNRRVHLYLGSRCCRGC